LALLDSPRLDSFLTMRLKCAPAFMVLSIPSPATAPVDGL